jgi:hypothetical protein
LNAGTAFGLHTSIYTGKDICSGGKETLFQLSKHWKNMTVYGQEALTDIKVDCVLKQALKYFVSELLVRYSEVSTSTVFTHSSFPTVQ